MGHVRLLKSRGGPDEEADRVVTTEQNDTPQGRKNVGEERLDGMGVLGRDTHSPSVGVVLLVQEVQGFHVQHSG